MRLPYRWGAGAMIDSPPISGGIGGAPEGAPELPAERRVAKSEGREGSHCYLPPFASGSVVLMVTAAEGAHPLDEAFCGTRDGLGLTQTRPFGLLRCGI